MAGFLVVGIALAVQETSGLGAVLLFLRDGDKGPGRTWGWPSWPGTGWDRKASQFESASTDRDRVCIVAAATLCVWTFLAGFGFGWVENLLSNGTVRSWAAPATGVGMALTNTLHAVGLHGVTTH
jgi:hypothetical protein